MLIGDGTYTKEVAQQVASGVKYLLEHPKDDRYFELPTIKNTRRSGESGAERIERTFSIRPDTSRPDVVTELADGGEIHPLHHKRRHPPRYFVRSPD